jgi:maleate isomerase
MAMLENIRRATMDAVDVAMSMEPDDLVMGMSAETFWDGAEGAERMHRGLQERTGRKVVMGSQAVNEALQAYGGVRRIAVITPYMPVGDNQVRRYFEDCGYEVVALEGLKCASPRLIAHVSETDLKRAVERVNGRDVDAIVQCGTNLAFARVAAFAEFWLEKPVIAINTATYWWALRSNGITDRLQGHGRLLAEF